jgi:hypothetical protein
MRREEKRRERNRYPCFLHIVKKKKKKNKKKNKK